MSGPTTGTTLRPPTPSWRPIIRRSPRFTRLGSVALTALLVAACGSSTPTASADPAASAPVPTQAGSVPATEQPPAPARDASSERKIDAAEQAGTIDHDTALLYKLYDALDYGRLPAAYGSEDPTAPEASSILAELSARRAQLTPDLEAKVAPFFLRPTEPESFWQARLAAGPATPGRPVLAAYAPTIAYDSIDAVSAPVRVWLGRSGTEAEVQYAVDLAKEIDSSGMWPTERTAMLGHEPCSDEELLHNGGNASLDVYLIHPATGLDWDGRQASLGAKGGGENNGLVTPERVGKDCPMISFVVLDAGLPFDTLKTAMAHELFHAIQFSFRNGAIADRGWFREASATWAEDLVYPALNHEQDFLAASWAATALDGPLDSTTDLTAYGAYIWPFYLRQTVGPADGSGIGALWQASESKPPIEVMHDLEGWKDKFKEFALWNWNAGPAARYVDNGQPLNPYKLYQSPTCLTTRAGDDCAIPPGTHDIKLDLTHASVGYMKATIDPRVRDLRFDLRELSSKPDAGVQALITIGNADSPSVEDWTGLAERDFCIPREDVRKIVLIVSNSDITADAKLAGTVKVDAREAACGGSFASLTWTRTWDVTGTTACTGDITKTHGTFLLSMVVSKKDGKASATLSEDRTVTTNSEVHGCGGTIPTEYSTKVETSHASGTVDATFDWGVDADGNLGVESGWQPITGTQQLHQSCTPTPCTIDTSETYYLEYDSLSFEAKVDPKRTPVVGSKTEDQSTPDGPDTIVYAWSLGE